MRILARKCEYFAAEANPFALTLDLATPQDQQDRFDFRRKLRIGMNRCDTRDEFVFWCFKLVACL